MSKVMSRYDVQIYLELIKPLEGGLMRGICESHQELLTGRESLIFALRLCRNHLEAIHEGATPVQDLKDVIKTANDALNREAALGINADENENYWD